MRLKLFEDIDDYVDITEFTWRKKTNTFSAEISDLHGQVAPGQKTITIKNFKTGNSVTFNFVKADMDGSNEDTYGWRYDSEDKKLHLLIIND